MNSFVRLVGSLFIFAIVLIAVEIGSYILVEFVVPQRAAWLLYEPPKFDETEFDTYLKVRDPLLGWPSKSSLDSKRYDSSGSRPMPAFPNPGGECITLYGDSYTYSSEVLDHEAWGNILSKRTQCRVGNFGVAGYGTDQALLRFQKNIGDTAPISILGIFPANIMRNVNQYRYLLNHSPNAIFGFKPRFILEAGQLHLVSLPTPSFSDLQSLDSNMPQILPHEAYLPGNGAGGPVTNERFPYSLVALNLFLNDRVQNWILRKPSWGNFVQPGQTSGALEVTVAVVKAFMAECKKREKNCFVITFPAASSYKKFKRTGISSLEHLLKKLTELDIPYLNFESYLLAQLGERSICELKANIEGCSGHFNPKGNQMIAEFVSTYISENSMLKKPGAFKSEVQQLDKRTERQ